MKSTSIPSFSRWVVKFTTILLLYKSHTLMLCIWCVCVYYASAPRYSPERSEHTDNQQRTNVFHAIEELARNRDYDKETRTRSRAAVLMVSIENWASA